MVIASVCLWGEHPVAPVPFHLLCSLMKIYQRKMTMPFGKFIVGVYDACGRQKAQGIVQRAVNEHWIKFRWKQRLLIS